MEYDDEIEIKEDFDTIESSKSEFSPIYRFDTRIALYMTDDSINRENRIKADLNKIYNQFQIDNNLKASLITYISGLDIEHRNLNFIAAAIHICYMLKTNNKKLTSELFRIFSDYYIDRLLIVFGVSKSDINDKLKNNVKVELLNYIIYICKNIDDFNDLIRN